MNTATTDILDTRRVRNTFVLDRAREILDSGEPVTPEKRLELLCLYTGVGGLVEVDEEKYGQTASLQQSKAAFGQYLTPLEVAQFLAQALDIRSGTVYDNCAGSGRLFAYLPAETEIMAVELQDEAFTVLQAMYKDWPGGATLIRGDCLEFRARNIVDYALGNPPFGLTWSVEDLPTLESASAHKGHVLSLEAATELQVRAVKPGGLIGLVLPETAMDRGDLRKWREWMKNQCVEMAHIALPNSGDEDPGTRWPCRLWLLQKHPAQPREVFVEAAQSFDDLNGRVLDEWKQTEWYQSFHETFVVEAPKPPEPEPPEPAPWLLLSRPKWKKGILLGTVKVQDPGGKTHSVCAIGFEEYWCMTCASETCPAIDAVVNGRRTRKSPSNSPSISPSISPSNSPKPSVQYEPTPAQAKVLAKQVKRHLRKLSDVPDLTDEDREFLRARLVKTQKELAARYGITIGWQRPETLQKVTRRYKANAKPTVDLDVLPERSDGHLIARRRGKRVVIEPTSVFSAMMMMEATGSTCTTTSVPDAIMDGSLWVDAGVSADAFIARYKRLGFDVAYDEQFRNALENMRRHLAWQLIPRPRSSDELGKAIESAQEQLKGTPVLQYLPTLEAYENEYWLWRERIAATGIELYEYQAHDAALMCMTDTTYLSYTPGLGKTRTALAVGMARHNYYKRFGRDYKALFVVPPGSVMDMAWADECKLVGLTEGEDFIIVQAPSDMKHPAPLHIVSYTRIANKPKPVQFDPVKCPLCGSLVTGAKCDNKDCGVGMCYVCHKPLDRFSRCQNPLCDKYMTVVKKVTRWQRGMEDLCPQCGAPTWNGNYCQTCGYSARVFVPGYYRHAAKTRYDMVVLDEAHYIKNARTLRGDAALALRGATHKIALGGTPIMGFVQDFCRQGQFLFAGDLGRILFPFPMERGSQKAFMDTFAYWVEKTMKSGKRRKVQEAERIKNADLFWRITDTLMIRRENEDEMVAGAIKLPPLDEKQAVVEPSDAQLHVIRWVENKFLELYRQQLQREQRGETFDIASFSALVWAARRAATVPSYFKHEYPDEPWPILKTWPKMQSIEAIAQASLADNRKLVVFTGLNPAAEELVRRLEPYDVAPLPLTHTVPPSKRTKVLRAFRTEDSPRIIVMGLLCGNIGLTLTSSKYPVDVLIADLDWSPSQIAQAIKRVYRPSQKYPVTAYTILTDASMDMDMLDLVYRKSKGIAQALDKVNPDDVQMFTPMSQREMLDEIAKRIESRQAQEAIEKAAALIDKREIEAALKVLRKALSLRTIEFETRTTIMQLSNVALHKGLELHPEQRGRYQDSITKLAAMARKVQVPLTQPA